MKKLTALMITNDGFRFAGATVTCRFLQQPKKNIRARSLSAWKSSCIWWESRLMAFCYEPLLLVGTTVHDVTYRLGHWSLNGA